MITNKESFSRLVKSVRLRFLVNILGKRNFDFESAVGFCAVVMQHIAKTKRGMLLYIDSSQGSFY